MALVGHMEVEPQEGSWGGGCDSLMIKKLLEQRPSFLLQKGGPCLLSALRIPMGKPGFAPGRLSREFLLQLEMRCMNSVLGSPDRGAEVLPTRSSAPSACLPDCSLGS